MAPPSGVQPADGGLESWAAKSLHQSVTAKASSVAGSSSEDEYEPDQKPFAVSEPRCRDRICVACRCIAPCGRLHASAAGALYPAACTSTATADGSAIATARPDRSADCQSDCAAHRPERGTAASADLMEVENSVYRVKYDQNVGAKKIEAGAILCYQPCFLQCAGRSFENIPYYKKPYTDIV